MEPDRCKVCGNELLFMGYFGIETLGGPDVGEYYDCPVCKLRDEVKELREQLAKATKG